MAADQRKKRLNSAGVVGYTFREQQHKVKRPKSVLQQYDSSVRSNISLEWDDKMKSVVPKREQIGICWRELSPYIAAVPSCHNVLADIVTVPPETFELENLTEVLSCEVWQTHLSEKERNLLTQFLPKGVQAQKAVQELLVGDNIHFGNPFLKWGGSLCSGNLHPDTLLDKERVLKANKKAYYSELQKYHHDMIGNLQMLKRRWGSCKDAEKEKLWRSKTYAEKTVATNANEFSLHDPDVDLVETSESCSSAAYDKASSNDDLNFMSLREDSQGGKGGFIEGKYDNSSDGLKVMARPRKVEKLQKRNYQCSDGAKYMSYIKISKELHQRVKSSMNHTGSSIQPRSLNHVLGDLSAFRVRPYKVFEEEERQNLHEHWSKLANSDVAAGFANWRGRQSEKWQVVQALGQEMVQKLNYLKEDDEKESPFNMPGDEVDEGASDFEPPVSVEDEEKEISDNLLAEQMDNAATNYAPCIALEGGENETPNCMFQQQKDNEADNVDPCMEEDETECIPTSQNQHLQQNTLLGGSQMFHAMDLESDRNDLIMPKAEDFPSNVLQYTENLSHMGVVPLSQGNTLSVTSNVWPAVSMPSAYYHSTPVSHEYTAPNELSLRHPQVMEEEHLISLEPDIRKEHPGKVMEEEHLIGLEPDLLMRQSGSDFFSPYPNQVRNGQFQSFFKGQGSLPYHNEPKLTGLDFQPPDSLMIENGQFLGDHLRDPSIALGLRQKRVNDLYIHQNIPENLYSDGVSFTIPSQEHFPALNIQDWAANAGHLSGPAQSHLNGGELYSRNWVSIENQARGGWSGSEAAAFPNQSLGNGSIADQSLFSVLSQCNGLHPSAPYDSLISNERFNQSGNYIGVGPGTSNVLPRTVNPLNYLSGHEAVDGLKTTNNMGWMNLPHQNTTALHDSMGKPYLRSWNH